MIKKTVSISNVLFLSFLISSGAMASGGKGPGGVQKSHLESRRGLYADGELLVQFKSGVTTEGRSRSLNKISGRESRGLRQVRTSKVKIPRGQNIEQAMAALRNDPNIESVQPNFKYRIREVIPNDPSFSQQWGLRNSGQPIVDTSNADSSFFNEGTGLGIGYDLGVTESWEKIPQSQNCQSVTVAVVDTGVNYNNLDFKGSGYNNMWIAADRPNFGEDFVDNDLDPMDANGHGTHVAGIIGARGNNGVGTSGVCWQASIMAVRVLDSTGSGATADIADGINFAVSRGAKIINLSLGATLPAGMHDLVFENAVKNAANSGVLVVAAAGNNGLNLDTTTYNDIPCSLSGSSVPNLICVAALNQDGTLASYSNYGATHVHFGAPGTNILSSWFGTNTPVITNGFDTYVKANFAILGSSFASDPWGITSTVAQYPSGFNGGTIKYKNGHMSDISKTYNLSTVTNPKLHLLAFGKTEVGTSTKEGDFLAFAWIKEAIDPFQSPNFTADNVLDYLDGQIGEVSGGSGFYYSYDYDINKCKSTTCSIGMIFSSDSSVVDIGVKMTDLQIQSATPNNNSYVVISGTSMAAPQVAGAAAAIMSLNLGKYDAAATIEALKNGSPNSNLAGKTITGKGVRSPASLAYIQKPSLSQPTIE